VLYHQEFHCDLTNINILILLTSSEQLSSILRHRGMAGLALLGNVL
jgi:hypothetical protein